jgi:hypothetical protein
MNTRQKEALTAAALGAFGGYVLPELFKPKGKKITKQRWWIVAAGAAAGLVLVYSHKAPRYGTDGLGYYGRTPHPAHPGHPYRNGTPAVWGGRQIRY